MKRVFLTTILIGRFLLQMLTIRSVLVSCISVTATKRRKTSSLVGLQTNISGSCFLKHSKAVKSVNFVYN